MSRRHKRTSIGGQFAPRLIEMLRSPAYRALSLSGHRVIARIEVELASHGGTMNGRLPVTYGDFQRYGVDRQSIASAIREVVELGFVEVTERGRPSESDFGRHPNMFRLTYRHGERMDDEPTHEWKRHTDVKLALFAARAARGAKDQRAVIRSKNKVKPKSFAGGGKTSLTGGENHPVTGRSPGGKSHPTVIGGETHPTIDISGREDAA
jgi:hypothetical protein